MNRYDYVGSFLRPERLKKARRDFENNTINAEELKKVEDECITDLITKIKELGYHTITDGEFRRSTWHLDFMWGFNGVEHKKTIEGNTTFDGEAAMIDGAGKVRQFFSITLPCLTPILFFNLVMQTIQSFLTFTPAYIISNGSGAPRNGTLVYSLYIYQKAFSDFKMGYASALAWILIVIIGTVTMLLFLTSKFWVFSESEEV